MLEIIKVRDGNEGYALKINGKIYKDRKEIYISKRSRKESVFVWVHNQEISKQIVQEPFTSMPTGILILEFSFPDINPNENIKIKDIIIERLSNNKLSFFLKFRFTFDLENWKNMWSIPEYSKGMEDVISSYNEMNIKWEVEEEGNPLNGCNLVFRVQNPKIKIDNFIRNNITLIPRIHDRAVMILLSHVNPNTLISFFKFPDSIQIPCEQYLLYFVKFLHDIGIEASADIKHEAGKVLFSVTPVNEKDALETIYQALKLYLQLPENPIIENYFPVSVGPNIQQLLANVQHLRGQLMLTNALIEAKNETIRMLQIATDVQQKIINKALFQDSLKYVAVNREIEDKESFFGGSFSLTKFEGRGFEINFPKIFRAIKKAWLKKS